MAIEKIKIPGAVLELPANQHCQFSPFGPFFEVNGLDWHCCLAGSSKTAPGILIFSIAICAHYSFEVKNIEIWPPAFFKHNNSFIATVPPHLVHVVIECHLVINVCFHKDCFVFADSEVESKNLTTKRHYCKTCSKNFGANHFLQIHMKTCHERTMEEQQCRICLRKFNAHSSLLNHLKIKHGVAKLPNEFAQTVQKGKSNLTVSKTVFQD